MRAIVRSLVDNVLLRRPTPYILVLEPNQRCNCRCPFCYHWRAFREGDMPLATIRRVLDEAAGLGCRFLNLAGGEPLIGPYLEETLAYAREREFAVGITTNGARLPDTVAMISHYITRLAVFLEYADERQDALRRVRGLYRSVVDGIREAVRLGVGVTITTHAFLENLEALPALADLAAELGARLDVRLLSGAGAALGALGAIQAPEDRARFADTLRTLRQKGRPIATPERYLRSVEHAEAFRCRNGRFVLCVDALGRVFVPCSRSPESRERIFGRLANDVTLRDIWYGSEAEHYRAETLTCSPSLDCYESCVHDVSRLLTPDPALIWQELTEGASLSRFYLATLLPRRLRRLLGDGHARGPVPPRKGRPGAAEDVGLAGLDDWM